MKIDGRLSKQYRINQHGKNIYIHKNGKNNYAIGINGTSKHRSNLSKKDAEFEISLLIFEQ